MAIDTAASDKLPARGEEFLRIFARYEYTLKETGFGRAGKSGEVEAAWDDFANTVLTKKFLEHVKESGLAPTLLSKPPSKQILNGGTLGWEEGTPPQSVQDLIGAVKRVRNNLVHGGKSGDKDSDRNDTLIAESISVLFVALELHSDQRYVFENRW